MPDRKQLDAVMVRRLNSEFVRFSGLRKFPKRIAIEIEMGTGHVVENIKKDVDAGFDSVASLLDDSRSKERVEQRLSKELAGPPRSILINDLH